MELLHDLSAWVAGLANSPFAVFSLFALAFSESSFFPIPPDVLLIPLALANPSQAFIYATIATIGSVIGGMFGFYIGDKGGKPILKRLVSKEKVAMVEHYYNKYDVWAVALAGFTPIPYKVFTISAGAFNLGFKRFILASLLGRGGRFYLVAIAIYIFGPAVKHYLDKYFNVVAFGFAVLLIGGFVLINVASKRFAKNHEMDSNKRELEKDK